MATVHTPRRNVGRQDRCVSRSYLRLRQIQQNPTETKLLLCVVLVKSFLGFLGFFLPLFRRSRYYSCLYPQRPFAPKKCLAVLSTTKSRTSSGAEKIRSLAPRSS